MRNKSIPFSKTFTIFFSICLRKKNRLNHSKNLRNTWKSTFLSLCLYLPYWFQFSVVTKSAILLSSSSIFSYSSQPFLPLPFPQIFRCGFSTNPAPCRFFTHTRTHRHQIFFSLSPSLIFVRVLLSFILSFASLFIHILIYSPIHISLTRQLFAFHLASVAITLALVGLQTRWLLY